MDEHTLANLRQRLGAEHLGKRLRAQIDLITSVIGHGLGSFHYENIPVFVRIVDLLLRVSGLKNIASVTLCNL